MKTCVKNLYLLPVLTATLGLILAGRVTAQTFTTLHSFTTINNYTNSDGANPAAGLILSGNTLYGTAAGGGGFGSGTVFAVNTNGTGFENLYSFTAASGQFDPNSDGANPQAVLILSGKVLYGTAEFGGSSGEGTVFALNTDGTGFTTLYSFTGYKNDGAGPLAGLVLSSNTLYGTACNRGSLTNHTVFAINTNGTGFATLHDFVVGGLPYAGLVLSSNTLYGTVAGGSSGAGGTVFKVNTDGTGFLTLHNFDYTQAGLILSSNTLYGTTLFGSSSQGTLFAMNTDGTGFMTLHNFIGGTDGGLPYAGLVLSANTLYGTTYRGGGSGNGTVFKVNSDGTGFTTLYSFTALSASFPYTNSDGANPYAALTLSDNTLYGTTYAGGSSGNGTVFSLLIPPQLTLIPSGPYVILTWPPNYAGFNLQSTTNLDSSAVWTTNSPVPIVVNGQSTVTNPISGTQQFFRLSQ